MASVKGWELSPQRGSAPPSAGVLQNVPGGINLVFGNHDLDAPKWAAEDWVQIHDRISPNESDETVALQKTTDLLSLHRIFRKKDDGQIFLRTIIGHRFA